MELLKRILPICILLSTPCAWGYEALSDTNFDDGFNLTATDTNADPIITGALFEEPGKKPKWRIAQWGSEFPIADAQKFTRGNVSYYENDGKKIKLTSNKTGSVIAFEVKAINEYKGKRRNPLSWPHLLIEQNIATLPKLDHLKSAKLSFEIKIEKPKKRGSFIYKDNRHTAQYVMYFTIQDRNQRSPGYGDYIWFGVPIYDIRHEVPPAYAAKDGGENIGTGKYIYTPDGREFWNKKIDDNRWYKFDKDILPHMKKAFEDAKQKNYLKNSDFEDMAISSTNTGWEITGPFDAKSEFKNFSLELDLK